MDFPLAISTDPVVSALEILVHVQRQLVVVCEASTAGRYSSVASAAFRAPQPLVVWLPIVNSVGS